MAEVVEDYGDELEIGGDFARGLPHRRFWPAYDHRRFRQVVLTPYTLMPGASTSTWTFAVGGKATTFPETAVCCRHVWHSEQRCVEQLCRRRGPKDIYQYLEFTKRQTSTGPSESSCMILHLAARSMHAIERWKQSAYDLLYEEIREERERAAKEEALQAKIEASAARIKAQALAKRQQDHHRRAKARYGKHGKKSSQGKVSSAVIGLDVWGARLSRSTLLAEDGQWQKWMDTERGGVVFYFDTHPNTLMPFQWDPPVCWATSVIDVASRAVEDLNSPVPEGKGPGRDRDGARAEHQAQGGAHPSLSSLQPRGGEGGVLVVGAGTEVSKSSIRMSPLQRTSSMYVVDPAAVGLGVEQSVAQREAQAAAQLKEDQRRRLVRRLVESPAFVHAVSRKLRLARDHLRAKHARHEALGVGFDGDFEDQTGVVSDHSERELGSEDGWSDSDNEAGDCEEEPGFQPRNFADLRRQRILERRKQLEAEQGGISGGHKSHTLVPELDLPLDWPLEPLPGGVGRGSTPRLLRPGVAIHREDGGSTATADDEASLATNSSGASWLDGKNATMALALPRQPSGAFSGMAPGSLGDELTRPPADLALPDLASRPAMAEPVRLLGERLSVQGRSLRDHVQGRGWRQLPREQIAPGFVTRTLHRHCVQASSYPNSTLNTTSEASMVGVWDPREDVGYMEPDFSRPYVTMFIENPTGDQTDRMNKEKERAEFNSAMQEELTIKHLVTNRIESGGTTEFTSADHFLQKQKDKAAETMETYIGWAITAVKNGDLSRLEEVMDDYSVPADSADDHGATLLILATQQGERRIVKFLLRRKADVNVQTNSGNTALHYAYEYGHDDLGDYLQKKGADAGIANAEGLTCFEGLHRADVDAI